MDPTAAVEHDDGGPRLRCVLGGFTLRVVHADRELFSTVPRTWHGDGVNVYRHRRSSSSNIASLPALCQGSLEEDVVDPATHPLHVGPAGDFGEVDGQLCHLLHRWN